MRFDNTELLDARDGELFEVLGDLGDLEGVEIKVDCLRVRREASAGGGGEKKGGREREGRERTRMSLHQPSGVKWPTMAGTSFWVSACCILPHQAEAMSAGDVGPIGAVAATGAACSCIDMECLKGSRRASAIDILDRSRVEMWDEETKNAGTPPTSRIQFWVGSRAGTCARRLGESRNVENASLSVDVCQVALRGRETINLHTSPPSQANVGLISIGLVRKSRMRGKEVDRRLLAPREPGGCLSSASPTGRLNMLFVARECGKLCAPRRRVAEGHRPFCPLLTRSQRFDASSGRLMEAPGSLKSSWSE